VVVAGDAEHVGPQITVAFREDLADIAANHHLDQFGLAHIGDGTVADQLPITEYGVIVCNAENLIKLVADEQDGLSLRLEAIDEFIKFLDFGVAEGGGGFIHDDHACINGQGAGDCHEVFVGGAKFHSGQSWPQARPISLSRP